MLDLPPINCGLIDAARHYAGQGLRLAYFRADGSFHERWRYLDADKTQERPPRAPDDAAALISQYGCSRIGVELPAHMMALDIDHEPSEGLDAKALLAAFVSRFNLPRAPTARTPRGGYHMLFRLPDGFTVRNWAGVNSPLQMRGVDIRTYGGLWTCPPSTRPDRPDKQGGSYRWIHWQPDIPFITGKLRAALTPPPAPEYDTGPRRVFSGELTAYCERALRLELEAVGFCGKGGRNLQLFKSAAALGSLVAAGGLPEADTRRALFQMAQTNGSVKDDGPHSVRATINSGFASGMKNPRRLPKSGATL